MLYLIDRCLLDRRRRRGRALGPLNGAPTAKVNRVDRRRDAGRRRKSPRLPPPLGVAFITCKCGVVIRQCRVRWPGLSLSLSFYLSFFCRWRFVFVDLDASGSFTDLIKRRTDVDFIFPTCVDLFSLSHPPPLLPVACCHPAHHRPLVINVVLSANLIWLQVSIEVGRPTSANESEGKAVFLLLSLSLSLSLYVLSNHLIYVIYCDGYWSYWCGYCIYNELYRVYQRFLCRCWVASNNTRGSPFLSIFIDCLILIFFFSITIHHVWN